MLWTNFMRVLLDKYMFYIDTEHALHFHIVRAKITNTQECVLLSERWRVHLPIQCIRHDDNFIFRVM